MLYPGDSPQRGELLVPRFLTFQVACRKHRSAGTTSIDPSTWSSSAGSWVLLRIKETLTLRPEIGWAVREAPTNA